MREETIIDAINDIDSIRCMVEDVHEEIANTPDYWERLLHQYTGLAMHAYVSDHAYLGEIGKKCKTPPEMANLIADLSICLANTLVEKLKNE